MIVLVRVRELGASGEAERVVEIALRLWMVSERTGSAHSERVRAEVAHIEIRRTFPWARVVMHHPRVQYDDSAFWDEMLAVNKVPAGHVQGTKPERVVATLDFFDDRPAVRQVDLILDDRKAVVAYNAV